MAKKSVKGTPSDKEGKATASPKKDKSIITGVDSKLAMALEKKHKRPVIRKMSEDRFSGASANLFSSGELGLDIVLGGGWARGKIHKIQGPWSSGKSHIVANAVAEMTARHGESVLLVDVEGAWTDDWLTCKGVLLDNLHVTRPESAEMALEIVEGAFESGEYSAIVLDSVAAMSPSAEVDSAFDEYQQALLARLMSKFLRKTASRMNTKWLDNELVPTLFITNQIRKSPDRFNPEFTPGGNQQDYHATTILELFKADKFWDGPDSTPEAEREYVGFNTRIRCIRNKLSQPQKRTVAGILTADYAGHRRHNFFHADTMLRFGMHTGVIVQKGAWYSIPGTDLSVQGQTPIKEAIIGSLELRKLIVDTVKAYPGNVGINIQFNPDLLMPPLGAEELLDAD